MLVKHIYDSNQPSVIRVMEYYDSNHRLIRKFSFSIIYLILIMKFCDSSQSSHKQIHNFSAQFDLNHVSCNSYHTSGISLFVKISDIHNCNLT